MNDFVGLLRRLSEGKVEYVLVGGLAAAAHGCTLVTQDVDICVRLGAENLGKLEQALQGLDPVHRMTPAKIPFRHDATTLAGFKNVYLRTKLAQLDCLGEVLGVGSFDAVAARSDVIDVNGTACRVISIDALIAAKSAMNRDRDRAAVDQLRRIKTLSAQSDGLG